MMNIANNKNRWVVPKTYKNRTKKWNPEKWSWSRWENPEKEQREPEEEEALKRTNGRARPLSLQGNQTLACEVRIVGLDPKT